MNDKVKNDKAKMVSFRITLEEYARLRAACNAAGLDNVSELARAAMFRIIDHGEGKQFSMEAQVLYFREKLAHLGDELESLAAKVAKYNGAGV